MAVENGTKHYGVVGLGRMGQGVAQRLLQAGFHPVVYDRDPEAAAPLEALGATPAATLQELVAALTPPRVVWMMIPAGGPVDDALFGSGNLAGLLEPGDVAIDGGNSYFRDSLRRYEALSKEGIHFLDCGTSGGPGGVRDGFCLMVGGEPEAFAIAEPLFRAIACEGGYQRVGPPGSGHYTKMVHNAIEYVMLQALGEGFEMLHAGPYRLDLAEVARLWNNGSVIRSWLLELAGNAFEKDPTLEGLSGYIGGGSTGRWAVDEAWEAGIPVPAMALTYAMRLRSRQQDTFSGKVIAALRHEFGGHPTLPGGGAGSGGPSS